ncbi:MAG: hypothetical protein H6895_15210 [Defluviimonas sp.]|nr:hypothetical protein [Rhodobiaceae bacterium]MCC0065409.1 hypothetical protein [Defluviimonas sp.]
MSDGEIDEVAEGIAIDFALKAIACEVARQSGDAEKTARNMFDMSCAMLEALERATRNPVGLRKRRAEIVETLRSLFDITDAPPR